MSATILKMSKYEHRMVSLDDARIDGGPGRMAKFFGAQWHDYSAGKLKGTRFSWAEVSYNFGLALALMNFGSDGHGWNLHLHLIWPNVYIRLPFLKPREVNREDMLDSWGFSILDRTMHFRWGGRGKCVDLPWSWTHHKTRVFNNFGQWVPRVDAWMLRERQIVEADESDNRLIGEMPYRYVLRSGEVQNVTAKIYVEKSEWRLRWLKWCPLFARVKRYINVNFDKEVGERSGSWKGGCLGCGYEMRIDETPRETLRRMQEERKF